MTFDALVAEVRAEGLYATEEQAAEVVRTVLAALGRQVSGEPREAVAGILPPRARAWFTGSAPGEPLTGREFVDDLAGRRPSATPATARWDAGSVCTVLARRLDRETTARVLDALPTGYALLFGQPEFAIPQPT